MPWEPGLSGYDRTLPYWGEQPMPEVSSVTERRRYFWGKSLGTKQLAAKRLTKKNHITSAREGDQKQQGSGSWGKVTLGCVDASKWSWSWRWRQWVRSLTAGSVTINATSWPFSLSPLPHLLFSSSKLIFHRIPLISYQGIVCNCDFCLFQLQFNHFLGKSMTLLNTPETTQESALLPIS